MTPTQAIQMADGSTLALRPGVCFQVLENGAVSMVDPSTMNLNVVTLPKSTMISSVEPVEPHKTNLEQGPGDSFGLFPSIPNIIREAAGRLQGTLGGIGSAISTAQCTPIVLAESGMSVVRGMCEQWDETSAEPECGAQPAGIANARGIFSGGLSALSGIRGVKTSILSDTMKIVSLIQDLVLLPLRFVAALRPLGSKATNAVDMVTREEVALTQILAQIYEEIFTNNINNITKLALVAAVGAAGLIGVCFLGAAVALVVGLGMIPVFWSLVTLLMFGLYKSRQICLGPL